MITLIDLYNEVTGQAWSMFDGEVEAQDEFETSVTSSIQKALSRLWCSYKFPFRNKNITIKTQKNINTIDTPNGNIAEKTVNQENVYGIKIGTTFLEYDQDLETLETKYGQPERFYIKNDKILLYPIPDKEYSIDIEYWSIFCAKDEEGNEKANLVNESDYIDIPEKYEDLFLRCLTPLCMEYAIASETDENFSSYHNQYEEAYKLLIEFTKGLDVEKVIGW